MPVSTIILIGFGIWLGVLTVFVFRMISHYNRLTKGMTHHTMKEVLEKILEEHIKNTKDIKRIFEMISALEQDGVMHLQRFGIVRFNPFSDTGGSQSFTFALLDGKENGVVMTSLYARTGNRWYIKHVKLGQGIDVELSREEKLAIKEARPVSQHIDKGGIS